MDHNYIEDEFIIEKFIAGELDTETRKVFFEHALQCPVCCKRVYLAGKVDEAILVAKHGWEKQIVTEPTRRRLVISYSAVTALVILAFIGGYIFNPGQKKEEQVAGKKETQTEENQNQLANKKKETPVIIPDKPKEVRKKTEIKKLPPEEKPKELFAMADAGFDLNSTGRLLNLKSGNQTKGIGSSEISSQEIIEIISNQSQIFNPNIDIQKPSSGEILKEGKSFDAVWEFQNSQSLSTVVIVNKKLPGVTCSYKHIKGMKIILPEGLLKGDYFMVVYEQGTRSWHATDFQVR